MSALASGNAAAGGCVLGPPAPLIKVANLAVRLSGREVLTDVDLQVRAGELVGLVGPNGAGKTTLLRSILGLVKPSKGYVHVSAARIGRSRQRLGYVPQKHEFAWEFPITVEDAVMTGRTAALGWLRRPGLEDWRAVNAALDRVQLADLHHRTVGELSGGQKQRVLVARALALVPQGLLLDEPFTGLDIPTQQLLTGLFEELTSEGTAIVMATHDLAGAVADCTRLCLVNRTVVADGTPADVVATDGWMRAFGAQPSLGTHSRRGFGTGPNTVLPAEQTEMVGA
ncbi:anchored repeat-type ABC transporter ATP-binding subunit [Arthrobacter sp.]|uniref:anchored repeat-type ABC transporter ATP-binding subunit n=1 Tax=Arthrobacter sp. TaxID=1667 RepID=UPI002811C6D4|nr:anchored repeat-type ABC transporter ATP-binding subunit [Arthrobacter sp.]